MALTNIIREECPKCGKVAVEKSKFQMGSSTWITLMCGHIITKQAMSSNGDDAYEMIESSDGKRLRPYQVEGIKFMEQADARCILGDEQGLGKMIQILCLLRLHKEKLLPAVVVCPTTIKRQWLFEDVRWRGRGPVQVINKGNEIALPGMDIYIITYDILKKAEDVFSYIDNIQTLVLDECQRIKNHLSDRAIAVQKFVRHKNIPHVLPTSGTIIKNNAGEAFTVYNLVAPTRFPHWNGFVTRYCDTYDSGWGTKVGGLRDVEQFHEDTKDIFLRRTKSEVLKDLPAKDRKFYHVDLDKRFDKAYGKALDDLDDILYDDSKSEFEQSSCILAIYSRMRHITGMSKLDECIDFTTEFMESCDRKLVIFTHHTDVAQLLVDKLLMFSPIHMHSGLSGDSRAAAVERFKLPENRIMIASTLAAGEGLNLQFCSDAVMLERQWNPANEEQAEDRFHRFGQENNVSITYMIASGTIDEYFTELVEAKRAIISAALDGKEINWSENNLMKDLANILVTRGRERWSIK